MAADYIYLKSVASTRNVGQSVAEVIDHMVLKRQARLQDIHIIGHSLGAHTAGFAGMYTKSGKSNEKVGRVTGLGESKKSLLACLFSFKIIFRSCVSRISRFGC